MLVDTRRLGAWAALKVCSRSLSGVERTRRVGWQYVLVALAGLLAKLPTLSNHIIFIDEPTYLVRAMGINTWDAFFYYMHDRVGQFPASLVPYIIADHINTDNAILLVRLFGCLAVMVSACLMLAIARTAFGISVPGVFATVIWLIFLNRNEFTLPPLLEYFQTPFLLAVLLLLVRGLDREEGSYPYFLMAGLCLGTASVIKLPAAPLVFPTAVAILVVTICKEAHTWSRAIGRGATLLAGFALILAIFILPYFLRPDTLSEFRFNIFDIAGTYTSMGDSLSSRLFELLRLTGLTNVLFVVYALILYLVALYRSRGKHVWDRIDTWQVLMLVFGVTVFVCYGLGQAKLHYMIASLPFFMLFVGYRLILLHRALLSHRMRTALFVAVASLIFLYSLTSAWFYLTTYGDEGRHYESLLSGVNTQALVSYIDAHTTPNDSIWVYYNAPEIYWMAHRKAATKEPTGSWLSQQYNRTWIDRTYNELTHDRPALIIGFAHTRYETPTDPTDVLTLDRIGDFITANYTCSLTAVSNTTICARKY